MPPVDTTRKYAFGYEHVDLHVVTTIVEKVVEYTVNGNNGHKTTSVVIRNQGGALVPVIVSKTKKGHRHHHRHHRQIGNGNHKVRLSMGRPRYFKLGMGKHYRHYCHHCNHHHNHHHDHRHCDKKKHHRHRHRKDSDSDSGADPVPSPSPPPGPDELPSSYIKHSSIHNADYKYGRYQQLPFTSFYNGEMTSRLADFALGEFGFLVLSFVLSLVLLFVGYKIGECVCTFENSRDRSNRGRGHKGSLARRYFCRGTQTIATTTTATKATADAPPQHIYLEDEEDSVPNDMEYVSENSTLLSISKPHAARTKNNN
ncbi:hypothetical protein J3B02_001698 [Coemansia erecta]|nr:hypothetical protein J3B02_001698 [Coemansia erecta]KAJ2885318.1 hypothetical protein FB639_001796 [Coemansia asiatica]